jgi:long-subunit fatty acid transport protein
MKNSNQKNNVGGKFMKLFRKAALLLIITFTLSFSAQSLYAQAGGAAVPFLLISPDARGSGMGEVGTAIADDINAIYWNPAGLAFKDYVQTGAGDLDYVPYTQIALSFSKWLPQFNADLYYSYATIGRYFEDLDGTVAFNFVFMNLGEFTRTFEDGTIGGKFLSNEFSFGLSYGTIVAKDFGVGFQLRYIQSNLAPASAVTGGDAGVGVSGSFDFNIL